MLRAVASNPASVAITGGAINGAVIGGTTPAAGTFTTLRATTDFQNASTDSSGTPGAATISTPSGRCSIAAAAASVVITSTICTATSKVFATINQAAADATALQIVRVSTAAGSFTIFANAAATATTVVDFHLINP